MSKVEDEKITSAANRLIKLSRSLHRRQKRDETGLYLVEGIRPLEEALDAGVTLKFILYVPQVTGKVRGRDLLAKAKNAGIPCYQVTENLLVQLSFTETPQGVIAVVQKQRYDFSLLLTRPDSFLLLVDGVQDPGNMGTMVRTAAAAGVHGVILTRGVVDLYNDKTLRATMGAVFQVPVVEDVPTEEAVECLRDAGIRLVAGDVSGKLTYFEGSFTGRVAIAVGNEGAGVSRTVLAAAAEIVKIPLLGPAESLNVAVATGILLYEAVRQRSSR